MKELCKFLTRLGWKITIVNDNKIRGYKNGDAFIITNDENSSRYYICITERDSDFCYDQICNNYLEMQRYIMIFEYARIEYLGEGK